MKLKFDPNQQYQLDAIRAAADIFKGQPNTTNDVNIPERIYFVAETKGSDDINDNHLSGSERSKIAAVRQHFAEIDVPYAAPADGLQSALRILLK